MNSKKNIHHPKNTFLRNIYFIIFCKRYNFKNILILWTFKTFKIILDFEWNDKCIYFTMMCVLFFIIFCAVHTISSWNNASIFNFGILFDWKVNIVGALGRSKLKFPVTFKSTKKNKIKMKGKREFIRKIDFS